jgi:chromosomal replication initiator protein
VEICNNFFVLHTPTEFKRDIIQSRFAESIQNALSDIFSADLGVLLLAGAELEEYMAEKYDDGLPEVAGLHLRPLRRGPSNKFAHPPPWRCGKSAAPTTSF